GRARGESAARRIEPESPAPSPSSANGYEPLVGKKTRTASCTAPIAASTIEKTTPLRPRRPREVTSARSARQRKTKASGLNPAVNAAAAAAHQRRPRGRASRAPRPAASPGAEG